MLEMWALTLLNGDILFSNKRPVLIRTSLCKGYPQEQDPLPPASSSSTPRKKRLHPLNTGLKLHGVLKKPLHTGKKLLISSEYTE